ncbi:MAG: penicillin acylase family protein [Acidobacteriota bacterium]
MLPLLILLILFVPPVVHAETVEIVRDTHGTPHIFANTAAGAAFGAGYAQAEDRLDDLLGNLTPSDDPVSAPVQELAQGYVAGIQRYFHDHPEKTAPPIPIANVAGFARRAFTSILGSNDTILGGSRTTARVVIASLDPITSTAGPLRPYEMTLYAAKEGLSLAGVAPVGMPFPIVGHTQYIAVGWTGDPQAGGAGSLEEAWALITAKTLAEAHRALSMNQIRGKALIGTSAGDLYDSAGALPTDGYLHRASPSREGDAVIVEELRVQRTWSFGRVQNLAFDTTVYQAEEWQKMLARAAPADKLARRLTGWNRRADIDSADALAFYTFKIALGRDGAALKPPDSLSSQRLFATLDRARDLLETKLGFNTRSNPTWDSTWGSTWGTLFRYQPAGSRSALPVGGGDVAEAGMFTPRAWLFAPGRSHQPSRATVGLRWSDGDPCSGVVGQAHRGFGPGSRLWHYQTRLLSRSARVAKIGGTPQNV